MFKIVVTLIEIEFSVSVFYYSKQIEILSLNF